MDDSRREEKKKREERRERERARERRKDRDERSKVTNKKEQKTALVMRRKEFGIVGVTG